MKIFFGENPGRISKDDRGENLGLIIIINEQVSARILGGIAWRTSGEIPRGFPGGHLAGSLGEDHGPYKFTNFKIFV